MQWALCIVHCVVQADMLLNWQLACSVSKICPIQYFNTCGWPWSSVCNDVARLCTYSMYVVLLMCMGYIDTVGQCMQWSGALSIATGTQI